jgi:phosphatidate cytidylyltransferase
MSTEKLQMMVFAAVFGALLLASGIAALLKLRLPVGADTGTIDNLNARTNAWWMMVAVLALAFWIGDGGIIALFAFISFQALREFISITHTRRGDHRALVWSFFFAWVFSAWIPGVRYVSAGMSWKPNGNGWSTD